LRVFASKLDCRAAAAAARCGGIFISSLKAKNTREMTIIGDRINRRAVNLFRAVAQHRDKRRRDGSKFLELLSNARHSTTKRLWGKVKFQRRGPLAATRTNRP
jgi:hypothetical protein